MSLDFKSMNEQHSEEESLVIKLDHHFKSIPLTKLYQSIPKYDSNLINDHQFLLLFRGKQLNSLKNPKLIYRASRDGFSIKDFHKCCDDQFKVVIIVKSQDGDLFGGYTTRNLRLDGGVASVRDDDLFTFRLENNNCYTFKLQSDFRDCALIRFHEIDAPFLFTFGYCFWVCPNANVELSSGSHQTENFIVEECKLPNSNTRYFGGFNFLVEELEVHKIIE